jgi:methylenetetrahydrofolate dehydrogenase (NADP+)/methenyltetrahydrofolate cyclohydrolase
MIVDGSALAGAIKNELVEEMKNVSAPLTLGIVSMSDSPVTEKYLARKKKFGESVGVSVVEARVAADGDQAMIESAVKDLLQDLHISGVLVQLPLPAHIDTKSVLNLIPVDRDPDILSDKARALFEQANGILPPVIGAMKEILDRNNVPLAGKNVVVVGEGNLVGKPAVAWAKHEKAHVEIVTEYNRHPESILREAQVLILGAGRPGLIQPGMIKDGVVLLDAGTTDVDGSLRGDADPACEPKCSLFTPVPGGIGPLTIALIFKNLFALHKRT